MVAEAYSANEGKQLIVGNEGDKHYCIPIKTRLITKDDKLEDVLAEYVKPVAQKGDIVFLSEKMVACTQNRAIPLKDIKPGFWATRLSKHVTKMPGGIGLGMPETMQCAIDECGLPRILLASAVSVVGKLLGKKGWFYHVAGRKAAAIDGPCHWTIPPLNEYVVLAPEDPDLVSQKQAAPLAGVVVLIVDLNDFGGNILGSSDAALDRERVLAMLKQNPLGQSDESTPIGILRPVPEGA